MKFIDEYTNQNSTDEKRRIANPSQHKIHTAEWVNGYFKNIDNLGNFEWIACYRKLKNSRVPEFSTKAKALAELKNMWQAAFSNPQTQTELFNAIWGNANLRNNLFGNINQNQLSFFEDSKRLVLAQWISEKNEILFKFIKVE